MIGAVFYMRIIFHVDMDSYFASVEQQANPFLIGKNVVVSGKEGSRTVIVAASKEAKRFGVKTAMLTHEARKLCPNLVFVEPDGQKYWEINRRFVAIFNRFTDKVELFSIDEAFLDLTGYVKNFTEARSLALKIKEAMKKEIGAVVTCSIGIAENKMLAKLASDLNKPNGVVVINEKNKLNILDHCKLTDFCGIGSRINKRLEMLGIETVKKLRFFPERELIKEFGPFYGLRLKQMAWGEDESLVVSSDLEEKVKSVSRSYTMDADTYDKNKILQLLLILSEKCGRELRAKKLIGKTIEIFFRFADFTHAGLRVTLPAHINDGFQIYQTGESRILNYRFPKAVRLIGVRISNLTVISAQQSLWKKERKRALLVPYIDNINNKYGEFTIKSGFLLDATKMRRKIGGFRYDCE